MADKPREKDKSKAEPEKKQAETVNLTAEELRAISGGTSLNPAPPMPQGVVKKPGTH
jgi:hypothetical protein